MADLSRCQAQEKGEFYRLNVPFELGLDFGCKHYGGGRLATKVILVLEEHRYRYQVAISDLAGSDIEAHHGDYQLAVRRVRNWLARISQCAVQRCAVSVGASPTRQESFQPVAVGTVVEVTKQPKLPM